MSTTTETDLTLHVQREIDIDAPVETAFEALLEQLGPHNEGPGGQSMSMKLEPQAGGRWYRDLGDGNGHLWGHVQVIKAPTLLEITGPLFMSYPAINHVQYRLEATGRGTRLTLTHRAFGLIEGDHREGLTHGWNHLLECTKSRAERG